MNLSYQIWVGFIFVCQKSLERTFKTGFRVQNHPLNLYSIAVNHKGYCVVKKLLWNVRIKAFRYTTNIIFIFLQFVNAFEFNEKYYCFMYFEFKENNSWNGQNIKVLAVYYQNLKFFYIHIKRCFFFLL